jgi:hypothetical protein
MLDWYSIVKQVAQNHKSKKSMKSAFVTKEQVRSMVKGSRQGLIKYVDTIVFQPSTASVNYFAPITLPVTGTGPNDMAGDSIIISHFEIHMADMAIDSTTSSGQIVFDRFLLCQSTGTYGSISGQADIYDQTVTPLDIHCSPLSYSNNKNLFKVLVDQKIKLDTFNETYENTLKAVQPKVKKLRYNPIDFNWPAGQPFVNFNRYSAASSGGSLNQFEAIVRLWFYDV